MGHRFFLAMFEMDCFQKSEYTKPSAYTMRPYTFRSSQRPQKGSSHIIPGVFRAGSQCRWLLPYESLIIYIYTVYIYRVYIYIYTLYIYTPSERQPVGGSENTASERAIGGSPNNGRPRVLNAPHPSDLQRET